MLLRKSWLYWIVIAVLCAGVYFLFAPSATPLVSGEVQNITLSFQEGNYYPQTITVTAGSSVRLTLDESVRGCYRSFTIPSLGVTGFSRTVDQSIVFTPTKKGTYIFRCSMGMGTGTLQVV